MIRFGKVINTPNLLSFFRVISAPVMLYLIFTGNRAPFTWLLTFAFLSDLLDGWAARHWHLESKLGSVIDSIGDSLTVIVGLIGLFHFHVEIYYLYQTIIFVVIGLHLLQMFLSFWRYGRPSSFHTWSAKSSALGIGVFILVTLHFQFYEWIFFTALGLLIIDAIEESILVIMLPKWENDVKGVYWVMKRTKK